MRLNFTLLTALFLLCRLAHAQTPTLPTIALPTIATPTVSIYVATNGNDNNAGTSASPLKTIEAAFNKVPTGTNGQQIYAEIVLKAGRHYRTAPISQSLCHYRAGGSYRNVGLRGEGTVVLDFTTTPQATATNATAITLLGNKISVKNISIKLTNHTNTQQFANTLRFHNSSTTTTCSGTAYTKPRASNILIQNVKVDSMYQHGMQVSYVDTLLIENCTVSHSCLINKNKNVSGWPSGIKPRLSTHTTVRNCTVFENYGEGIISNRSAYSQVYNNTSYNNFCHNIYVDNGEKVVVRNNLSYNNNPQFWRGAGVAASGVTIGTEYYTEDDWGYLRDIYIFNNVLINSGKGIFWSEGRDDNEPVPVYHTNIWIAHNSVIGTYGNLGQSTERLRCLDISMDDMKDGRIIATNGNIYNNIFSINPSTVGSGLPGEPAKGISISTYGSLPTGINFGKNLWNMSPLISSSKLFPYNASTDQINAAVPYVGNPANFSSITPTATFMNMAPSILSFVTQDYKYITRTSCNNNVGALTKTGCTARMAKEELSSFTVYPNPTQSGRGAHLYWDGTEAAEIAVYNMQGKIVWSGQVAPQETADISIQEPGMYLVRAGSQVKKLVVE